jgi:HSP20 family protein
MLPILRANLAMTPWTTPVNRLENLFDHFFDEGVARGGFRADGSGVPMAVWQDEDHVHVEAELPGLTDQDVEIVVHNGVLFIRGERRAEEGRQYLYNSRTWGRFERVITLPEEVDAENVQAELVNGVLRLALPKTPASKPKKITLKTSKYRFGCHRDHRDAGRSLASRNL